MNLGATTVWVAYSQAGVVPADYPVAFYQRTGWPLEIYEFADLSARADDPEIKPLTLTAISWHEYSTLYDKKFDTGMCTTSETWKLQGIAMNVWIEAAVFGAVALCAWWLCKLRGRGSRE